MGNDGVLRIFILSMRLGWLSEWPCMNDYYQDGLVQTKRESCTTKSHAKDLRKARRGMLVHYSDIGDWCTPRLRKNNKSSSRIKNLLFPQQKPKVVKGLFQRYFWLQPLCKGVDTSNIHRTMSVSELSKCIFCFQLTLEKAEIYRNGTQLLI